ncbi:MAG: hypothetical protein ACI4GW_07265 [Lachnospiraceae bacterium]
MTSKMERYLKDSFRNETITENAVHKEKVQRLVGEELSNKKITKRISYLNFVFRMIRFVSPKIWFVQGICFILLSLWLLAGGRELVNIEIVYASKMLCLYTACIPFVSVPFLYRSIQYNMQEIEMAASFSYVQQLMMKLLMIAVGDMVMLLGGIIVGAKAFHLDVLSALLYVTFPFLLISSILLFITVHVPANRMILSCCILFATMLFILNRLMHMYPVLFTYQFNRISFLLCVVLVVLISLQLQKLWNNSVYQEMHLMMYE